MKTRSLLILAGLAISFALPAFCQERDAAVDPQIVQQLHAIGKKSVWENGEWSGTFFLQGEDCGPHQVRGYFASINVREGNTWRVCMSTFSISPQRPTTTATNQ